MSNVGTIHSSIDLFVQLRSEGYSRDDIRKLLKSRRGISQNTKVCIIAGCVLSAVCLAATILVIGMPMAM